MKVFRVLGIVLGAWLATAAVVNATIATYSFSSEEIRHRYQQLTAELRCPKCQNQNIADSNAEIAKDLRTKVFQMLEQGKSEEEIIRYMTERYGDFVLYQPRLNVRTALLWGGPVVLLLLGLAVVFGLSRHRRRTGVQASKLDAEQESRLQKILKQNKD